MLAASSTQPVVDDLAGQALSALTVPYGQTWCGDISSSSPSFHSWVSSHSITSDINNVATEKEKRKNLLARSRWRKMTTSRQMSQVMNRGGYTRMMSRYIHTSSGLLKSVLHKFGEGWGGTNLLEKGDLMRYQM